MTIKRAFSSLRLLLIAIVVAAALITTLTASAAFPGKNGKIVFGSEHAGEDEIWLMDADGSNRFNLTRHDGRKTSDIDPRWSPDGHRIVFASDRTGSMQVWVMNANGTSPTQLTNLPDRNRFPAFTADGKQIVFQSVVAGNFEIYRMNADGSGVTNLTNDAGVDWAPATSSRGKKVVFTSERDGNGHLYIWSPDEALVRVTNTAGYDYFGNWSPKGNDLVFIREDSSGENDIFLVHTDGTGERRLTNTPGVTEFFPAFSPDGKKITFTACAPPSIPAAPNPDCAVHTKNIDGTGEVDLAFPTPPTSYPWSDDFDDNARNIDRWAVLHDGTGGFENETNHHVELTITPDAMPSSGPFPQINVRYEFACVLNGDFDAQVDYELLDWPAESGAYVHLNAGYIGANVSRQSESWGESYGAAIAPSSWAVAPTSDTQGRLRLVRTGTTVASYYWSVSGWVQLLSGSASDGPGLILLELAAYESFSHELVRVAFDNFRIDADEDDVDCSHYRPDWHPDWQPIGR